MMDLIGHTYGRLTVICEAEARGNARRWLCKCACGVERTVQQGNLRGGHTVSCGCAQKEKLNAQTRAAMLGVQFGRLTVESEAPPAKAGKQRWNCRCVCGGSAIVLTDGLRGGHTKSCGCLSRELTSARKSFPMLGKRFGRLVVASQVPSDGGPNRRWICKCDCGEETVSSTANLHNGHQRSCGCLQREMIQKGNNLRHGKAKTPEWWVWVGMRKRCNNPNDAAYANYGGRGIKICERWSDFAKFFQDMGPRPPGRSIDRIDTDGDYSPENCRWATNQQQMWNKRNNLRVKFRGKNLCVAEWCDLLGLPYGKTLRRIQGGWSPRRAFRQEA